MKKILCLLITLLFCITVTTQTFAQKNTTDLTVTEKIIVNTIDYNKTTIFDISKQIWNFKEPGNKEIKSSALLEDSLEKQGFSVQRGVTGIDPTNGDKVPMNTAFIATYKGLEGGLTIGIMVEYDALPNGHACGHNLLSEAGYAAAIGLKEVLKTTHGTVIVYGCPAEETTGSKQYMLKAGLMDKVDTMLCVHGGDNWSSEVSVKAMVWPKYQLDGLVFTGKASHASLAPEKGRSALDAAILMGTGIEFLREHIAETDRIHYVFLDGGKAANVVPDYAKVDLMVRANDSSELMALTKRVDNIIKGAALMTDTTAKYEWDAPLLAATLDPELYHFVANTASSVGISEDKFVFGTPPGPSTDAGNVAYEIPTAQVLFPITEVNQPPAHTDEFRDAAIKDYALNNSMIAGKIMALTGYRILTNPEELKKIKADFAKNHKK